MSEEKEIKTKFWVVVPAKHSGKLDDPSHHNYADAKSVAIECCIEEREAYVILEATEVYRLEPPVVGMEKIK